MSNKKVSVKDYYTVYADKIKRIRQTTEGMDQFHIMHDVLMPALMKRVDPELDSS